MYFPVHVKNFVFYPVNESKQGAKTTLFSL